MNVLINTPGKVCKSIDENRNSVRKVCKSIDEKRNSPGKVCKSIDEKRKFCKMDSGHGSFLAKLNTD